MADDNWNVEAPEQQSRLARLCLSHLERNGEFAAAVHEELFTDPRGERTATHALLHTLVAALVDTWTRAGEAETIAAALRGGLLDLERTSQRRGSGEVAP